MRTSELCALQVLLSHSDGPPLGREEERELVRRSHAGDQAAKEWLVEANLRFVVSVAKEFPYAPRGPLPLQELVSAGCEGLLEALRRYDPDRGLKLISYAVWWIRQAMRATLASDTRVVRLPANRLRDAGRLEARRAQMMQRLGREATTDEEESAAHGAGMSAVCLAAARHAMAGELSLDAPEGTGKAATSMLERLADRQAADAYDLVELRERGETVEQLLLALTARERDVIERYYGLRGERETQAAIARAYGLTGSRIQQVLCQAMGKLRRAAVHLSPAEVL